MIPCAVQVYQHLPGVLDIWFSVIEGRSGLREGKKWPVLHDTTLANDPKALAVRY